MAAPKMMIAMAAKAIGALVAHPASGLMHRTINSALRMVVMMNGLLPATDGRLTHHVPKTLPDPTKVTRTRPSAVPISAVDQ